MQARSAQVGKQQVSLTLRSFGEGSVTRSLHVLT